MTTGLSGATLKGIRDLKERASVEGRESQEERKAPGPDRLYHSFLIFSGSDFESSSAGLMPGEHLRTFYGRYCGKGILPMTPRAKRRTYNATHEESPAGTVSRIPI